LELVAVVMVDFAPINDKRMNDTENMAVSFAKWIDLNYYQGKEYNTYTDDLDLIYTIDELFEMFKRLNN
jgi:hypothetical protein